MYVSRGYTENDTPMLPQLALQATLDYSPSSRRGKRRASCCETGTCAVLLSRGLSLPALALLRSRCARRQGSSDFALHDVSSAALPRQSLSPLPRLKQIGARIEHASD